MGKIYNTIIETIGNTPMVKLNRIAENVRPNVFVKMEAFNPMASVKDRVAMAMMERAEKKGHIDEKSIIVEPTSGNTGIGLALVCAVKGYQCILIMPESVTIERRKILKALGAEIILTPAEKGMNAAIKKAEQLSQENSRIYIPQQFQNPANPEIHRKTTALEIYNDLEGKVNGLVAAVGTGGTITGVGEVLKQKCGHNIKIYALEPKASPVLSGGIPKPHKIQGMGAGFIPEVLNTDIYDKIIQVSYEDAKKTSRKLARMEGIFVGISAGAATWAGLNVAAKELQKGENLVIILPDTGERYLSTDLFEI
ncbi:MAG: Cysteine synthase [Promethearchaeota archaeon]|nr:MAG: Cysteine synthase [Candidatus Lokiarchaeota archaeon]